MKLWAKRALVLDQTLQHCAPGLTHKTGNGGCYLLILFPRFGASENEIIAMKILGPKSYIRTLNGTEAGYRLKTPVVKSVLQKSSQLRSCQCYGVPIKSRMTDKVYIPPCCYCYWLNGWLFKLLCRDEPVHYKGIKSVSHRTALMQILLPIDFVCPSYSLPSQVTGRKSMTGHSGRTSSTKSLLSFAYLFF